MIEQELGNLLPFERPFATLLTMIEVDPDDPAFSNPTKFIGPVYSKAAGRQAGRGKAVGLQAGRRQVAARRAVAGTEAHLRAASDQVAARAQHDRHRRRRRRHSRRCTKRARTASSTGVECVIDKDLASELLARDLDADLFVMLTDAEAVYVDWGKPTQKAIRRASPAALVAMTFAAGSMGPKVAAACRFAAATGKKAAIGALADLSQDHRRRNRHDGERRRSPALSTGLEATKSLGLAACTAIVVGNMVGSGFYLSPSAVAPYGLLAIVAWIVMGIGAVCLGLTFARLARMTPATGGPYAYTRLGYGDFAGFLVAWGYWISIWASLPVIAVAFTGSLAEADARAAGQPADRRGHHARRDLAGDADQPSRREGSRRLRGGHDVHQARAVLRHLDHRPVLRPRRTFLGDFNPSGKSLLDSSAALAPLTMFAYLGLESATVPAGDVRDPERTIPRSTMLGILMAGLLYVLGTTVVMGVVPREQLVASRAPFADAARLMWGPGPPSWSGSP